MKSVIAASVVAVGTALPAMAADVALRPVPMAPVATAHDWTGFYVGAHLGYGIDKQRANSSTAVTPLPFGPALFTAPYISEQRSQSHQSRFRSVLGGVQIGYNYQYNKFVFGAEGDVTFGNLKATAGASVTDTNSGALNAAGANAFNLNAGDVVSFSNGSTFSARHRLGTFGTLRGRIGYAFDRYLVYLTGGVAFADMQTSATATNFLAASANLVAANPIFVPIIAASNNSASTKTSRFAVGGAFGGGVEVALTRNWSVKAEYLYIALPNQNVFLGGNFRSFSNTFHVARAGLNYRF